MSDARKFSDEQLMAYADGELDAQARADIELAMQADTELSARIAQHEALRSQLRAAFDPVLEEPVPPQLVDAARTASAPETAVADLAAARLAKSKRPERRWSWPEWGAMAASLAFGFLAGYAALVPRAAGPVVAEDGRLVADGVLATALSRQLAQQQTPADAVQMGPSFVSKEGEYCRTFTLRGEQLAGLACREQAEWQLQMLVKQPAGAGEGYRMAGSAMPRAIMEATEERMAGEALDAPAEAEARRRGWQ